MGTRIKVVVADVGESGVCREINPSRPGTRRWRVQSGKCVKCFKGIISARSKDVCQGIA